MLEIMQGKRVEFKRLKVLVFDQNALMRRAVKHMLEDFGIPQINIHGAHDVAEAFSQINTFSYDLLLLDYLIDGMNGSEFTYQLRRDEECKNRKIPVILTTPLYTEENITKAVEAGVNSILAKPFTPKDLYLRFHILLARPQAFVIRDDYVGPEPHLSRPGFAVTKTDPVKADVLDLVKVAS